MEYIKQLDVSWHLRNTNKKKEYYVHASKYLGMINGKPKYKTYVLHRYIMRLNDRYSICDHKDYDGLNNRKSNLRVTKIKLNSRHRSGKNKNNTSGYRNVSWNKDSKKWVVQMQVDGTNKILGYFEDVNEAGEFAKIMRDKYYGKFAGRD